MLHLFFFHMSLAILAYGLFSKAGDWLILPFFKGVAPNIVKPFFEGLWVVTAGLTFFKGVACVTPLLDTILLSRLRLLLLLSCSSSIVAIKVSATAL